MENKEEKKEDILPEENDIKGKLQLDFLKDSDFKSRGKKRIKITFKPLGTAPIIEGGLQATMKARYTFAQVIKKFEKVLRSECKVEKEERIILHINNFIPSPNQVLGDLFDCFGVGNDELIVGYAFQVTWG